MKHRSNRAILAGAALAALLAAGPAAADVKAGVEAWSRGDYAGAVHQWEGPAAAGDADAMFNLAQAYRLGRGVAVDPAKAEALYARAAAKGHLQAADTYGLMLFQDGRREAAVPYLQDAAKRGDPRSEYLLGIAHFNGDVVPKDWIQAYALLTMANAQGLPQAAAALAQMDQNIPLAQRQQAAGLAVQMQKQADQARGRALAAVDLGAGVTEAPPSRQPAVVRAEPRQPAPAKVAVSPSIAAALAAVAEARQATGTESPADAGASFARPRGATPRQVAAVAPPPAKAETPAKQAAERAAPPPPVAKPSPSPARATAPASTGPWRVQLGAFSVRANADRLWAQIGGRDELAGKPRVNVAAGSVTKLQAAGFATRDAAEAACHALQHSGHECLVTR